MKFFITLTLLASSLFAHSVSINPVKTVTPFIDIFSTSNKQLSETEMQVRVSSYNNLGEIYRADKKLNMPMADYQRALLLSKAVFRMVPTGSSVNGRMDKMSYEGTAFHIGENLVLTNHHVLSRDFSNATECDGFQLKDNTKDGLMYPCKKVHYCNSEHDVCLIEMGPKRIARKKHVEMKEGGAALKLLGNQQFNSDDVINALISCIGNTMGKGVHFSQGRGAIVKEDVVYFFAPLRSGNSGGPIIGKDNLVWGVARQESAKLVSSDSFNVAVSAKKVISLMQEQLTDPVVLGNFNKAIQE